MPTIGILIVAYNAETTLDDVLARIPSHFIPFISVVLICDDASQDDTFTIGKRAQSERSELPIQLIRQPMVMDNMRQSCCQRWLHRLPPEEQT